MLISVAVRLADSLGLRSTQGSRRLSVLARELRGRLWFCLGVLDIQSAFDRGSRALIDSSDFVDWPSNVDDKDITIDSISRPVSPDRFTEMSFGLLTFRAGICQRKLTELGLKAANETASAQIVRQQQLATLVEFESCVRLLQTQCGTTLTKIEIFTIAVAQESLVAMRLLLHRPLHKRGNNHGLYGLPEIGSDELLTMATEVLERSQSKRSWMEFAQWAWFKWVKWYALAVVLAELCTASGLSADHAWVVAQRSFDDYATIVADTDSGLLWKPIARLMQRARTVRTARTTTSQAEEVGEPTDSANIQWHDDVPRVLEPTSPSQLMSRPEEHMPTFSGDTTMGNELPAEFGTDVDLSWFHWDLLIDDIETQGLNLDTSYHTID